jgi:nicotinamide-nucleotide amidase
MSAGEISEAAQKIVELYARLGLKIATAESCTGGMVAAALTGIPGSSAVIERGFVTYSNDAKAEMLGVAPALIAEHGAVSEPVARMMAEGALSHSTADVAVSITGIAGPGGGSVEKPVGLVHFACARLGATTRHVEKRFGDLGRHEVRERSVVVALALFLEAISESE